MSFQEDIDDKAWLKVNGQILLNDTGWNRVTSVTKNFGEGGWHDFEARFSRREIPDDIPEVVVDATGSDGVPITTLLREAGLAPSGKEARRSCLQGAVRVAGEKVEDPTHCVGVGAEVVVQVGRRKIAKVTVR